MNEAIDARKKILLVEDDAAIGELLSLFLQQKGFAITVCRNGRDAVDIFKKDMFALVILDLMLPGKDGYSICRDIRGFEKNTRTPVIILSALAQKEEIDKGISTGADAYITKPYENKTILLKIQELLRLS